MIKKVFAIPDNITYSAILQNSKLAAEKYGIKLITLPEGEIAKYMINNHVDAALMNPISYGKCVLKSDFRIVSGPALAAYGFTGMASIYFNSGLKSIEKYSSEFPDDFLFIISDILLKENYNIHADLGKSAGTIEQQLENSDAVFAKKESSLNERAMDITEEWSLAFDMPLPIAFWAVRNEEGPENIESIINDFASSELIDEEDIQDVLPDGMDPDMQRSGILFWKWSDEIKNSLDQTMQLLYFHQYLPEIPAAKIYMKE